jgi:hypothetical protein
MTSLTRPPREDRLEINPAIREVIELTRGEAVKNGVSVQTELAEGLPVIQGDRVQLQQVMLNLIINAVEAIGGVGEGSRELLISSGKAGTDDVRGGTRFRSGCPGDEPRAPVRAFLHDQAGRFRARALDLSFDHPDARRAVLGEPELSPRRHLSIHATGPAGALIIFLGSLGQARVRRQFVDSPFDVLADCAAHTPPGGT